MTGKSTFNMAENPPKGNLVGLSDELVQRVLEGARTSPRKRMILPLHKGDSALLQRMLNAIQPGSYIRPHRHAKDRAESIIVLRGAIRFLIFDDRGEMFQTLELRAGTPTFGIDFEGGVWHSFQALEKDTVLFEVKPGPYNPDTDKEFAPWAPEEFSDGVKVFLESLCE